MLHASVAGAIPSKYDIRHGQDPVPGYGREDLGSGGASPDGKYSWKRILFPRTLCVLRLAMLDVF